MMLFPHLFMSIFLISRKWLLETLPRTTYSCVRFCFLFFPPATLLQVLAAPRDIWVGGLYWLSALTSVAATKFFPVPLPVVLTFNLRALEFLREATPVFAPIFGLWPHDPRTGFLAGLLTWPQDIDRTLGLGAVLVAFAFGFRSMTGCCNWDGTLFDCWDWLFGEAWCFKVGNAVLSDILGASCQLSAIELGRRYCRESRSKLSFSSLRIPASFSQFSRFSALIRRRQRSSIIGR